MILRLNIIKDDILMSISQIIQNKQSDFKLHYEDEIVCSCYNVNLSEIKMVMHSRNAKTIDSIIDLTNAGKGM